MSACTCGDLMNLSCPVHGYLTLAEPTKQTIVFAGGGGTILTIHPDGRLERGPGFTNDDAASLALLDCLSRHCPGFIGDLRRRAETSRDNALEEVAKVAENTYENRISPQAIRAMKGLI